MTTELTKLVIKDIKEGEGGQVQTKVSGSRNERIELLFRNMKQASKGIGLGRA